jgi:hypothetical protein
MKTIIAVLIVLTVAAGIFTLCIMFAQPVDPLKQEDDDKAQIQFIKDYNKKRRQKQ